ncbi:RICIN domain-containing protein [Kitasatospora sp. NPDC048540]|uniref:RICIN domain-containing protein n=1 Tax=Kitasatospora sp. NPDC048540 TaxID=3155634 RepID=UPI0033F294CD
MENMLPRKSAHLIADSRKYAVGRKLMRSAAVAGAAALVLAAGIPSAGAASGSPRFMLKSFINDNKCMAIGAGSTAGGAGVIQWDCYGGGEQQWYAVGPWYPDNNRVPYYQIVNFNSGKCLADPGTSPYNGVQLIQYGCDGGPEQFWYLDADLVMGTAVQLIRYHSGPRWNVGQCAADGASSTANGAPIVQWTCTGGSEQRWYLKPV